MGIPVHRCHLHSWEIGQPSGDAAQISAYVTGYALSPTEE